MGTQDGRIKSSHTFALVESEDIVLLLPWLMAFSSGWDYRPRDAPREASEETKLERATSACRHAGGVKMAARNLLEKPRKARGKETWSTPGSIFPAKDHAAV